MAIVLKKRKNMRPFSKWCAESKINKSEYYELLLATIKAVKVFGNDICLNCGLTFDNSQSLEAAKRLLQKI